MYKVIYLIFLSLFSISVKSQDFKERIIDFSNYEHATFPSIYKVGADYYGLVSRGVSGATGLQYNMLYKCDDGFNFKDSALVVRDSANWGIMEYMDIYNDSVLYCLINVFNNSSPYKNELISFDHDLNKLDSVTLKGGDVYISEIEVIEDSLLFIAGGDEKNGSIYLGLLNMDMQLLKDTIYEGLPLIAGFSDPVRLSDGNYMLNTWIKYRMIIDMEDLAMVRIDSSFYSNQVKVLAHPNGFIYSMGQYSSPYNKCFHILKRDSTGRVVDSAGIGVYSPIGGISTNYNFTKDEATILANGNILTVAIRDSTTANGKFDGIEIYVFDPELNLLSHISHLIDQMNIRSFSAAPTDDGGAIVVGNVLDYVQNRLRGYYLKMDSLGQFSHIGLPEEFEVSGLSVYPNPSQGTFSLKSTATPFKEYNVELFNLTGQKVLERHISTPEVIFDEELSQGQYFIVTSAGQVLPLVIQ